MAFIEPMHRNKPNITYLLTHLPNHQWTNNPRAHRHRIFESTHSTLYPKLYYQCHKFGHTKNSCKGKAVCAGCGDEGHVVDDCENEPKCVNCEGDHYATSKDCPKWDLEKRINKTEIYREDFICRCSQTSTTTIFWPFQEFLCYSDKDSPIIYKTTAALGSKHPIAYRFWHWSAVLEIQHERLPNTIGRH